MVVSGNDINAVRNALKRTNEFTDGELDELVRFCEEETYGRDEIVDDIDTFEEGDSAIIEHIAQMFNWNSVKAMRFTHALRKVLGISPPSRLTRASSYANVQHSVEYSSVSRTNPFLFVI